MTGPGHSAARKSTLSPPPQRRSLPEVGAHIIPIPMASGRELGHVHEAALRFEIDATLRRGIYLLPTHTATVYICRRGCFWSLLDNHTTCEEIAGPRNGATAEAEGRDGCAPQGSDIYIYIYVSLLVSGALLRARQPCPNLD